MSDTNDGKLAGGADDHVGNPPFFYHFSDVLKRVEQVSDDPTCHALLDGFLFLYMSVLDLYRKFEYVYRANAEHLSPNTPFSQDDLEFLRMIALNHEEVEEYKARARERAEEAKDEDDGRRRQKLAVIEVLEKQVHELWAGHQEAWHRNMEQITSVPLTRPVVNRQDYRIREVHQRRRALEVLEGLTPELQRSDDRDEIDHRHERKLHGRAAAPRRWGDDDEQDYSSNGDRAITVETRFERV